MRVLRLQQLRLHPLLANHTFTTSPKHPSFTSATLHVCVRPSPRPQLKRSYTPSSPPDSMTATLCSSLYSSTKLPYIQNSAVASSLTPAPGSTSPPSCNASPQVKLLLLLNLQSFQNQAPPDLSNLLQLHRATRHLCSTDSNLLTSITCTKQRPLTLELTPTTHRTQLGLITEL